MVGWLVGWLVVMDVTRYVCSPASDRQVGVVWRMLHALEPGLFPENPDADGWYSSHELSLLCMALRVSKNAFLPTETHGVGGTVQDLVAATSQHYLQIGKPLSIPRKEPAELLQGYFRETDPNSKKFTCILDAKEQKTMLDFSSAEEVEAEDPLDLEAPFVITMNARKSKVEDLRSELEGDGVELFPLGPQWKGELFVVDAASPAKRQRRGPGLDLSGGTPSPASSSSEGGRRVLSAALRKRLADLKESRS